MTRTARFILIAGFLSAAALLSILFSALAMQAGDDRLASWSSKAALAFAIGLVIYVLPRLAQNFRLEALRSELNTRLSVGGWLFLAACVVVGALALITVNNLLYLVFSVMGATLLVCAVACRLNVNALDARIRFPDHIYAGEPARFRCHGPQSKTGPSSLLSFDSGKISGAGTPWTFRTRLAAVVSTVVIQL